MLIDTHCHFDAPPFCYDLASSANIFRQAGINSIIVPAVSVDNFSAVLALAHQYQYIYCALGLHPIYHHKKQDLDVLATALQGSDEKIIAIGEIGLDCYNDNVDMAQQLFYFTVQLDLAKQFHLPVILHSRRAHPLLYKALKKTSLTESGVIHGFAGSYEEAMQFIRLGFYIGVGGLITYKRANKTRNAISRIPLSAIVLETDAPDMPLSGYQGQPNRPEYITEVLKVLVTLRAESAVEIQNAILMNTLTVFSRINTMKIS